MPWAFLFPRQFVRIRARRQRTLPRSRLGLHVFGTSRVDLRMTSGAKRNQVLFVVATRLAAEFAVVYLEVLHAAANLASPAVALQHVPMQFAVVVRIESESRAFAADLLHEAFRLTSERKASCCGLGKNL